MPDPLSSHYAVVFVFGSCKIKERERERERENRERERERIEREEEDEEKEVRFTITLKYHTVSKMMQLSPTQSSYLGWSYSFAGNWATLKPPS